MLLIIYYNASRTHRSLDKDAPFSRPVQRAGSTSVFLRAWMPRWSRDDEKPVSNCNRFTSGCDAVSVIDGLIARYAARTIGVIGLIGWLVLRATYSWASDVTPLRSGVTPLRSGVTPLPPCNAVSVIDRLVPQSARTIPAHRRVPVVVALGFASDMEPPVDIADLEPLVLQKHLLVVPRA
jgi:hypothetical protein